MKTMLTALLMALAMPALAADWTLRAGDEPLDLAALDALAGQTLTFYDDGRSMYSAGGAYSYTYSAANGGGSAYGTWRLAEDGSVCVAFRNGFSRCDLYVMNGDRLILITEDGERYPVRP